MWDIRASKQTFNCHELQGNTKIHGYVETNINTLPDVFKSGIKLTFIIKSLDEEISYTFDIPIKIPRK